MLTLLLCTQVDAHFLSFVVFFYDSLFVDFLLEVLIKEKKNCLDVHMSQAGRILQDGMPVNGNNA